MTTSFDPSQQLETKPQLSPDDISPWVNPDSLGTINVYWLARDERELVETYLIDKSILVGADGAPRRFFNEEADLAAKLARLPIDHKIMEDELMEIVHSYDIPFARADVARALRMVCLEQAANRNAKIMRPLYEPLSVADSTRAEEHFAMFARIIDAPSVISITGVKQFIWSVKTKQLGGRVGFPMMIVLWNTIQGSGKSEFVLRLLKPLGELASDPMPFDEVSDPRSAALFQNAAGNIDDAGALRGKQLAGVKTAITAHDFQRRVLGTSRQRRIENRTTFIATTNEAIHKLVSDPSGHRRFLVLPFRNGAVEKGGDPEVWKIMDELDFELMWRSVSHKDKEPILAIRAELHAFQQGYIPPHPFAVWLNCFDFENEAARNLTGRSGIRAKDFYELYREETGDLMSDKLLGEMVNSANKSGKLPIGKKRTNQGEFFFPTRSNPGPAPGSA